MARKLTRYERQTNAMMMLTTLIIPIISIVNLIISVTELSTFKLILLTTITTSLVFAYGYWFRVKTRKYVGKVRTLALLTVLKNL